MSHTLIRREFLQIAGAAAAGSVCPCKKRQADRAAAANPRGARLRASCCAYSYRKYLSAGQMSMEEFILKGVEYGLDAVDMTTYWFKSTEPSYLAHLRHFAYKNGMPFSGAAIGTNMCQADPNKRAAELEKIKQWVDRTQMLGTSHLRVFGGELPKDATLEQGIRWVAETMKPACDYAAQKGIIIGIENHHGITEKASTIIEILRRVDSPFAGINLDIGNYHEDQYPQLEASVPFATHVHVKSVFSGTKGPVDFERVWQILAKGGYRGFTSLEYEDETEAMDAVPKKLTLIKSLCRKYSEA